ncbi:hypothetical protein [Streptomyces bauhiniae]|uniref:hypothetical protein n=1 Tax=Streptomyces bauhiniae TaxID=2340725 RepID=UPI003F50F0BF
MRNDTARFLVNRTQVDNYARALLITMSARSVSPSAARSSSSHTVAFVTRTTGQCSRT